MKESDYEKELKRKVMKYLMAEWEHGTEREKLFNAERIKKVIDWIESGKVKWDYEWE